MKTLILIFVFLSLYGCSNAEEYSIFGGTIINIKRLDNNNEWVTEENGGRYKYLVDCNNCGECWRVQTTQGDKCYLISESGSK